MADTRGGARRGVLVVFALAGVALVTVGVVWVALTAGRPGSAPEPKPVAQVPEPMPAPGSVTPTADPSHPGTSAAAPSSTPTTDGAGVPDLIVYRRDGELRVARGDGTAARTVAASAGGPYALSPDGRVLAYVSGGRLMLVPVEGGPEVDSGPALGEEAGIGECPVWAPDSRYVYVARLAPGGGSEVWRVRSTGRGAARVMAGGCPTISPDGRTLAALGGAAGEAGKVVLASAKGDRRRTIGLGEDIPVAVALADEAVYVAVLETDGGSAVVRMSLDGTSRARVVGAPADAPRASWGMLRLAPDGSRLAAVAMGDDRYSRVSIVDVATGRTVPVGTRRDCYARYWSPDGSHLYYVEGNSYQGEATRLLRVQPTGIGRALVAEGAE